MTNPLQDGDSDIFQILLFTIPFSFNNIGMLNKYWTIFALNKVIEVKFEIKSSLMRNEHQKP